MYCFIKVKGFCDRPRDMAQNFALTSFADHFSGKFYNLEIRISQSGIYYIQGSIWKYYLKHNYKLFFINEFKDALDELNSLSFGTLLSADLIAFELGTVIELIHDPSHYLSLMSILSLKNRPRVLRPSYKNNILWKMETQGSFENMKFYNKSFESKIKSHNLMRCEYVVKNVKKAFKCRLNIEDLLNPLLYLTWSDDFKEAVNSIAFKPPCDSLLLGKMSIKNKYKSLLLSQSDLNFVLQILKEIIPNRNTLYAERSALKKLALKMSSHNSLQLEMCSEAIKNMNSSICTYNTGSYVKRY